MPPPSSQDLHSKLTYPPPPRRTISPTPTPASTLYAQSPHHPIDDRRRRRQIKTDPTWTILLILFCALIYWSWPGVEKAWKNSNKTVTGSRFTSSPSFASQCDSTCALLVQEHQRRIDQLQREVEEAKMPFQKTFSLASRGKGCHLVTDEVMKNINEGLKGTKAGILTLFIQHTSAGLTLNENFDRDVRTDMDMAFDKIVPESLPWRHTDEGPDDSASHTKTALCGTSITVPITDGKLNLGTWQGVYLCEFRAAKHTRRLVATILP